MMERRHLLGMLPVTLFPAITLAGQAGDNSCAPAGLTPEQFDRMYKRLMGKWRLVPERSTFLVGNPPKNPSSFLYTPEPGKALGFTNENGKSVQTLDGKTHDASPTIPGTMLARILHDEFTVENVLSRKGRITARNMQIYAPDGTHAIYISRDVNDAGDKTPRSFMLYEKVPDSTRLWWEKA